MTYIQPNPNGQATKANSSPVVIASDQDALAVTAASLPLPSGAATGTKQDTGNTSLASIDTKTPALGQALAAASTPVVLTAAQVITLTPPAAITGFATETTLGNVLTTSDFDTKTGSVTETAPATDTASSGLNGRLQRIAQRLSSLIGLLPTALGANGGLKIEGVASGTVVPVSGTITANAGSNLNTSALALDATLTGGTAQTKLVKAVIPTATTMQNAATGNANGTSLDVQGYATAVLNITASVAMSGGTTINFEASVDDTTWVAIYGDPTGALTSPAITTTTTGDWSFSVSGYKSMRARISAYSAGTITVKGYATVTTDTPIAVLSNLALNGTAVDGNSGTKSNGTLRVVLATDQPALTNKLLVTPDALPANQSVNVSQINGVTPLMGSGIMGTGSPRVTIASDNDALTVKQGTAANLKVEATIASAQTLGTVSTVTSLTQMNGAAIAMGTGARSAGTQRVTIATDDVVPASQSGTWTVQPGNTANTTPWLVQDTPATAGGLTYTTNSIKATATSLKASAGQVYGWYIYNSNTSAVYVQFFNTLVGSVTLGTTPPVYTLGIPAGAAANVMIPHGILHTTAIVIAATTTATGLTAPTNNVDINVFIK